MSENEKSESLTLTKDELLAMIREEAEKLSAPLLAQIGELQAQVPKTLPEKVQDILSAAIESAVKGEDVNLEGVSKDLVAIVQNDESFTSFIGNPLKSEFYATLDQMKTAKAGDTIETPIGTFTFREEERGKRGAEFKVLVADSKMPVSFVVGQTRKGAKQVAVEANITVNRFNERILKFTQHEKAPGGWSSTYGSERRK